MEMKLMVNTQKYKEYKINGIGCFEDIVMEKMPDAEKKPIHVKDTSAVNEFGEYQEVTQKEGFWNSKNVAIVNTNTKEVAQIASDSYRILQHKDFFLNVADNLRKNGITDIKGYVRECDGGNSYTARMIFNTVEIEEPSMGTNIKVGGEFSNSYNSSYAAKGAAFYLRLSCTNQMRLQNIIPECVFSRSHMAVDEMALYEAVTIKAEDFMRSLIVSGVKFREVMENSIDTDITYDNPLKLDYALKEIFGTQKHSENISELAHNVARKVGNEYSISQWDLYNVVTDYASHTPLAPNIFDQILIKGEANILNKPVNIPEKIPIPIRK
jgi:hypothetical protein